MSSKSILSKINSGHLPVIALVAGGLWLSPLSFQNAVSSDVADIPWLSNSPSKNDQEPALVEENDAAEVEQTTRIVRRSPPVPPRPRPGTVYSASLHPLHSIEQHRAPTIEAESSETADAVGVSDESVASVQLVAAKENAIEEVTSTNEPSGSLSEVSAAASRDETKVALEAAQQAIKALEDDLQTAKELAAEQGEEVSSLKTAAAEQTEKLKAAEQTIVDQSNELSEAKETLAKQATELKTVKKTIAKQAEEIETAKRLASEERQRREKLAQEQAATKSKLESVTRENEALVAKLKQLEEQASAAAKEDRPANTAKITEATPTEPAPSDAELAPKNTDQIKPDGASLDTKVAEQAKDNERVQSDDQETKAAQSELRSVDPTTDNTRASSEEQPAARSKTAEDTSSSPAAPVAQAVEEPTKDVAPVVEAPAIVETKEVEKPAEVAKVEEPPVTKEKQESVAAVEEAKPQTEEKAPAPAQVVEAPKAPNALGAVEEQAQKDETQLAAIDPADLLPFPRENPRPKVLPKLPKGPLYIKKPLKNDNYTIFVLGDSLGSGLWQGLHQNFRGDVGPSVKIVKKAKANTGIVRNDRFDWMRQTEQIAAQGGFEIAMLMFGANDAQTIRVPGGKRHHFKRGQWEEIYRQRIDRIILALKKKGVAIYWVGLPNVRIPSLRDNYVYFNSIFKEKAEEHGIAFIDTWNVSNNANGQYQASGKGLNGRVVKLRAKDGTHFTSAGYRLLASYPERILRPHLEAARASALAKGLRLNRSGG